jgi:hypothetical protein
MDHGWTVDNEGEVLLAKMAKQIVEAWAASSSGPSNASH